MNSCPLTAAVCLQDPDSPRTWSGTPAHLIAALRRRGMLIDTFAVGDTRAIKVVSLASYQSRRVLQVDPASSLRNFRDLRGSRRSDYLRMCGPRHRAARRVARLPHKQILHVGWPFALPPLSGVSRQHHFLICDSTWSIAITNPLLGDRFSADAVAEAEGLESRALHACEAIFAISGHVRDELVNHYHIHPSRVHIIGTGPGAFSPYAGPKDYELRTVLFVAKVRPEEKGLGLLLNAFRRARAAYPVASLVLVGHPSYPALSSRLDNVSGYDHVTFGQLEALFHEAALYAMPAIHEPWGLVYLEALLTRTPVLGLDRLALPEITQQGGLGFLSSEATTDAVTATLMDALSSPERLRSMGLAGRDATVHRYSWDRSASIIQQVMRPDLGEGS
jgi:glycosyltransferase involved in cell wall biosynthesis